MHSNSRYKKVKLIYNPKSGQGNTPIPFFNRFLGIKHRHVDLSKRPKECIQKIQDYLNQFNIFPEVIQTTHPKHGIEIAKECVKDTYDLVIVAGGDGSINEVINGLVNSSVALGVIPLGTVNIYAIQTKIPLEIKAACQVIATGLPTKIDLGKLNDHYFVCMAGIGFDANVIKKADSWLKKYISVLAYVLIGIRETFTYKFPPIHIQIDHQKKSIQAVQVIVSNSNYYGGELVIAKNAKMSDGLLDACIIKKLTLKRAIISLLQMKQNQLETSDYIDQIQCKTIRILNRGKHPMHIDAEYIGQSPATIKVMINALTIIK